jgi:hypothetical protein
VVHLLVQLLHLGRLKLFTVGLLRGWQLVIVQASQAKKDATGVRTVWRSPDKVSNPAPPLNHAPVASNNAMGLARPKRVHIGR